jgi:hypothetical protein
LNSACVSRNVSEGGGGKFDILCETVIEEDGNGVGVARCKCPVLSATSFVGDVSSLLGKTNLGEIFSLSGLTSLAGFKFW